MAQRTARIGVLTGGGDAPGLNAVIRAVVKAGCNAGLEVIGLEDSFDGLLDSSADPAADAARRHRHPAARRHHPRHDQPRQPLRVSDRRRQAGRPTTPTGCVETFGKMGLDALVVIGGDGTLAIAHQFYLKGIPVVGVPKTIDNDIVGTTSCFGFDTAVSFASDAIDRLHTTAEAHRRIMVVEVMGRYAGWIALHAGIAGGADVILIPGDPLRPREGRGEHPRARRLGRALQHRRRRRGREAGGRQADGRCARRARIGRTARWRRRHGRATLEAMTGKESRSVVLGHLQRGGSPTPFDRVLATRFGAKAVELVRRGVFGRMVANNPPDIVHVPLADVVGRCKTVPLDYDLLATARALGVSLGD